VVVDPDGYNLFDLLSASEVAHESEVSRLATRTSYYCGFYFCFT